MRRGGAADRLLERQENSVELLPVLPVRGRRRLVGAAGHVLPLNHAPTVAGDPQPVHVARRRRADALGEIELEDVAHAAAGARPLAVVDAVDARIEHLPRREQPVAVVDESLVGVFEETRPRLPFHRLAVDEDAPLARLHVEVDGERRPGLVRPGQPVVSRRPVPRVREARDVVAFPLEDEVELELAGPLPCGLAAERRDELAPDRVRPFVGARPRAHPSRSRGRGRARHRPAAARTSAMICPALDERRRVN